MGIITHPDQMAKLHEQETDGPMFPKGPHQMVAYCYSMAGTIAYERSVHCRLIDMMNSEEIEPFDPASINMSGHTMVERVAECGQLVRQIEEVVLRDHALIFRARFLSPDIPCKQKAMDELVGVVKKHLSRGNYRRYQRSNAYYRELVVQVLGPPKERVYGGQVAMAEKYGMLAKTVCTDLSAIGKLFRGMQDAAFMLLKENYKGKPIFSE